MKIRTQTLKPEARRRGGWQTSDEGDGEKMKAIAKRFFLFVILTSGAFGCQRVKTAMSADDSTKAVIPSAFSGLKAGDRREVAGVELCWCPPGRFMMGSPRNEPERRPDEKQVEVTLTRGFWMSKFEVTQGQWKRVIGKLPGELTEELPAGDDFPVGNVNFAEAEAFSQKLTELGRRSGDLPIDWEFRPPTEAQWEYACRAGTRTATSFGDKLSSRQANFKGKPYNGSLDHPYLKHRPTRLIELQSQSVKLGDSFKVKS